MNHLIKLNDWVYIPSLSTRPLKVLYGSTSHFCSVDDGDEHIYYDKNGKIDITDSLPSVWVATPENKHKIEAFYGISLEDIPEDKLALFKERLQDFQSECENYSTVSGSDTAKVKQLYTALVQMYEAELDKGDI